MKKFAPLIGAVLLIIGGIVVTQFQSHPLQSAESDIPKPAYWFMLHRKSNVEYLYLGQPGEPKKSELVRMFRVKTGIVGERPTPLPELVGREYWVLTDKQEAFDNPETAPYFLTLDVPAPSVAPYGPTPYFECDGQCDWELPGAFGLHGVAGNPDKLSADDPGSSGCIRHTDEDVTFLYELLDPKAGEIRYYVRDI